jgi:hypothetical protein
MATYGRCTATADPQRPCENTRRAPMKVPLSELAHTRSGDKGDTCNIGVIALR